MSNPATARARNSTPSGARRRWSPSCPPERERGGGWRGGSCRTPTPGFDRRDTAATSKAAAVGDAVDREGGSGRVGRSMPKSSGSDVARRTCFEVGDAGSGAGRPGRERSTSAGGAGGSLLGRRGSSSSSEWWRASGGRWGGSDEKGATVPRGRLISRSEGGPLTEGAEPDGSSSSHSPEGSGRAGGLGVSPIVTGFEMGTGAILGEAGFGEAGFDEMGRLDGAAWETGGGTALFCS